MFTAALVAEERHSCTMLSHEAVIYCNTHVRQRAETFPGGMGTWQQARVQTPQIPCLVHAACPMQ